MTSTCGNREWLLFLVPDTNVDTTVVTAGEETVKVNGDVSMFAVNNHDDISDDGKFNNSSNHLVIKRNFEQ